MSGPRRGTSIAQSIFLLVLASIVAATLVTVAITFAGPPPRPAPVQLAELAEALRDPPARRSASLKVTLQPGPPVPLSGQRPDPARDAAIARLAGGVTVRGYYEDTGRQPREVRGSFTVGRQQGAVWRTVRNAPDAHLWRWLTVTVGAMLAALAVLSAVAWWVARAISQPVVSLAAYSETARPGASPPPALARGPREVRTLGRSFAAMHARLAAHTRNRTAMLAAIAHDLGTPLSRIAFWIEQLPEGARTRAAADIDEMRAMLGDVLRFARDEQIVGSERIDLGSVLDALVDDLAVAGQPVSLVAGDRVVVEGDAGGLRRLFANVLENAVRYGGAARMSWALADNEAVVRIEDDGPGFAPDANATLFEPFVRGDPSRNRGTGGTGLGLAIVRSLAEAHGGRVTLRNRPEGGLVEVRLPLARRGETSASRGEI